MSRKIIRIFRAENAGFSMIELMIAISIVGVILIALSATFQRSGRLYTTQNVSAALQEEVRASVEIMAREIRMAGYDPFKTGDFEIETATATHLLFTLDLNEDGIVNNSGFPNCERLSFRYSNANEALQIICGESTGGQDVLTLIGGGFVSFWGPVLGTAVFFLARDILGAVTSTWLLWYGLMFMVIVMFKPEGIAGIWQSLMARRGKKPERAISSEEALHERNTSV